MIRYPMSKCPESLMRRIGDSTSIPSSDYDTFRSIPTWRRLCDMKTASCSLPSQHISSSAPISLLVDHVILLPLNQLLPTVVIYLLFFGLVFFPSVVFRFRYVPDIWRRSGPWRARLGQCLFGCGSVLRGRRLRVLKTCVAVGYGIVDAIGSLWFSFGLWV